VPKSSTAFAGTADKPAKALQGKPKAPQALQGKLKAPQALGMLGCL
jgi:hypothetical protein